MAASGRTVISVRSQSQITKNNNNLIFMDNQKMEPSNSMVPNCRRHIGRCSHRVGAGGGGGWTMNSLRLTGLPTPWRQGWLTAIIRAQQGLIPGPLGWASCAMTAEPRSLILWLRMDLKVLVAISGAGVTSNWDIGHASGVMGCANVWLMNMEGLNRKGHRVSSSMRSNVKIGWTKEFPTKLGVE